MIPSLFHPRAAHPGRLFKAVAGLCILLVLLVGAASLLHSHPAVDRSGNLANSPADSGCSLCLVAHLAASPAPIIAGPAITVAVRRAAAPDPLLAGWPSFRSAFHIRPPPVLTPQA